MEEFCTFALRDLVEYGVSPLPRLSRDLFVQVSHGMVDTKGVLITFLCTAKFVLLRAALCPVPLSATQNLRLPLPLLWS